MTKGVRDLARIAADKVELGGQYVLLVEEQEARTRPWRKAAEEKSVAIMSGMLVERVLRLDLGKMTQVLTNLLSNAIKFTASGGSIDVDSDLTKDGGLVVWIRDTGQGIPAEDLDRVLQPFGQLEDHLTRQNDGIGLGLPVARALIGMHGGELSLTS